MVDGVVAIVGKNPILHSDILQQSQLIAIEQKIDPSKSPYLFENIYKSTLNSVIDRLVFLTEAEKDTNIIVSNEEVDRALNEQINDFINRSGSEDNFLEMVGMSMRDVRSQYWKDIKNMMLIERFQYSKIQSIDVGRVEVEIFYNTYKDSIPDLPEQYSFSIIDLPFIASKQSELKTINFLNEIKADYYNNVSFDSLAIIHSDDPGTGFNGGYLGYTTRGSLVKEYEEVAYSLNVGEVSKPIKSPFGYHLIKLIDRQGEKISTQHILKIVKHSDKDKQIIIDDLNYLKTYIDFNTTAFDSIANSYSAKYNNLSGIYLNYPINNISKEILNELSNYTSYPFLSNPIILENSCILVYCYNHQEKIKTNLLNSWSFIYELAKQHKQNAFLTNYVDKLKKQTYIKINI